jgi:hypothetical protein
MVMFHSYIQLPEGHPLFLPGQVPQLARDRLTRAHASLLVRSRQDEDGITWGITIHQPAILGYLRYQGFDS